MFTNGVNMIYVPEIAERCNVEQRTVTKWIRENKIPAKKSGKRWYVREDYLKMFMANNHTMPPDYLPIDNKAGSHEPLQADPNFKPEKMRPILTFSNFESSKAGWAPNRITKFPPEFEIRIANILQAVPQYGNQFTNFIRDAVGNRILDLEEALASEGLDFDQRWAAWHESHLVKENHKNNDAIVAMLKQAARCLKQAKNKENWEKFVAANQPRIKELPPYWRKKAKNILEGKGLEIVEEDV